MAKASTLKKYILQLEIKSKR